jgi:hypothetical protein
METYLDRNRRLPGLHLLFGRPTVKAHAANGQEGKR